MQEPDSSELYRSSNSQGSNANNMGEQNAHPLATANDREATQPPSYQTPSCQSPAKTEGLPKSPDNGRHGVVAIVYEEGRLLIIRRSPLVRAPNLLCLPGGGIEAGESLEQAMLREMKEELNLDIRVDRHLWTSVTRWGTKLEWMICSRLDESEPQPNPWEVSEFLWMTLDELRVRDDLLGSLPDFLAAIDRNEIDWP